jgi:hypothetical protein
MLFWKALLGLITFDVLRCTLPFRRLCSIVKSWPIANESIHSDTTERVCYALNLACIWYFKQVFCLQRSFVTVLLLRGQGIGAEMVLGAQKMPFRAHAWVEVGGRAVNERAEVQTYSVWERC